MDDTSLSGIQVRQVALLSDRWRLRPTQSVVGPAGVVLHPQESLICVLLAVRDEEKKMNGFCESVSLSVNNAPMVDFRANPYRSFIHELEKNTSKTTLAVSWTVITSIKIGELNELQMNFKTG